MKNITRHQGTLEIIRRLPSSSVGNPRFLCRVAGHTFRTQVDSAYGYSVQNLEGQEVVAKIGTHYGLAQLAELVKAVPGVRHW